MHGSHNVRLKKTVSNTQLKCTSRLIKHASVLVRLTYVWRSIHNSNKWNTMTAEGNLSFNVSLKVLEIMKTWVEGILIITCPWSSVGPEGRSQISPLNTLGRVKVRMPCTLIFILHSSHFATVLLGIKFDSTYKSFWLSLQLNCVRLTKAATTAESSCKCCQTLSWVIQLQNVKSDI